MTTEEKMIWSTIYGAHYAVHGDVEEAIGLADEGVEELKNKVRMGIRFNNFGVDMAKEMVEEN